MSLSAGNRLLMPKMAFCWMTVGTGSPKRAASVFLQATMAGRIVQDAGTSEGFERKMPSFLSSCGLACFSTVIGMPPLQVLLCRRQHDRR